MQSETTWDERKLVRENRTVKGPALMWAAVQARLAARGNLSAWVCEAITEKLQRERANDNGKTK